MVDTKQDFKFEKNPFTLDMFVRAHAHCPNVAQIDLIVVVVIIGVVVAVVVDVLQRNWEF